MSPSRHAVVSQNRSSDEEDEDEVFVGYSPQRIKVVWSYCSLLFYLHKQNMLFSFLFFTVFQVAKLRQFGSHAQCRKEIGKEVGIVKVKLNPHPTNVVESKCFRAVQAPPPSYNPALSPELIRKGCLSDVQYESVVYAGMRHSHLLRDGMRAAYFIGDGTGTGKGRQLAAIILVRFGWLVAY